MAEKLAAAGVSDVTEGVQRIRCITCGDACTLVQVTEPIQPFTQGVVFGFVCCGPTKHMTFVRIEEAVGYAPVLRIGVRP